MSDFVRDQTSSSPSQSSTFSYPYASAPDIIRSHQKDTYFQSQLSTHLTSVARTFRGARFTHTYAADLHTIADLVYFCLTTFLGNRTLGEEYCDIVQLEELDHTSTIPQVWRRGAYIFGSVLVPYGLQKVLPAFRRKLRTKLEISLRRSTQRQQAAALRAQQQQQGEKQQERIKQSPTNFTISLQTYLLKNLDTLTSPSPIYALSLAAFYFTGAYYHLAKRLLSLRYIFTRRLDPSDQSQRGGYEILGVLLILQMSVQAYLHAKETFDESSSSSSPTTSGGDVETNTTSQDHSATQKERISRITHTSFPPSSSPSSSQASSKDTPTESEAATVGYTLENTKTMSWIESPQQRNCTLCLEAMRDPAATTCGHVFCWICIRDWLAEKQECPLCRQSVLVQKVLPLRG